MTFSPDELGQGWSLWTTCLRSFAFSFAPEDSVQMGLTQDRTLVLKGSEAYQFLLEVICGLHSPILGETEVFGQFKAFSEKWMSEQTASQSVVQALFSDAKKVRKSHLSGLGSQSYGSWVRRTLNGSEKPIHIVGSGQLTKDILPWIIKSKNSIKVYCRSYPKALLQLEEYSDRIEFIELSKGPFKISGSMILCAPVTSDWMSENFSLGEEDLSIDLRDNSHFDLLRKDQKNLFHLKDVFSELESSKQFVIEKVAQAQLMIQELCQNRFSTSQLRPYGWDDLCT